MEDPETLIAYAKIFEKPRRYVKGGTLHPPGAMELVAAKALRFYAKCLGEQVSLVQRLQEKSDVPKADC